jgi:hypothetical protein
MFAASIRLKRSNRPVETVEPLSKKLGIPIDDSFDLGVPFAAISSCKIARKSGIWTSRTLPAGWVRLANEKSTMGIQFLPIAGLPKETDQAKATTPVPALIASQHFAGYCRQVFTLPQKLWRARCPPGLSAFGVCFSPD